MCWWRVLSRDRFILCPHKRTGKYSFMVCVPVYVSVCRRLLQAFNMCEKPFLCRVIALLELTFWKSGRHKHNYEIMGLSAVLLSMYKVLWAWRGLRDFSCEESNQLLCWFGSEKSAIDCWFRWCRLFPLAPNYDSLDWLYVCLNSVNLKKSSDPPLHLQPSIIEPSSSYHSYNTSRFKNFFVQVEIKWIEVDFFLLWSPCILNIYF